MAQHDEGGVVVAPPLELVESLGRGEGGACRFLDNDHRVRREPAAGVGRGQRRFGRAASVGRVEPFSLAFLDPPYGRGLAEAALASAHAGGWLTPDALIVVEEAASAGFAAPEGFDERERRRYDDTALIVLRHHG